MDHVSDDFTLTSRGYNKKDAERMLRLRLMRNNNVHVHYVVRNIEWTNDGDQQAKVEIVAAMAGTDFSLTDMPSFRGDMVKFNATFELVDGEYVITETTWQRQCLLILYFDQSEFHKIIKPHHAILFLVCCFDYLKMYKILYGC